jgi:hypothetical protein
MIRHDPAGKGSFRAGEPVPRPGMGLHPPYLADRAAQLHRFDKYLAGVDVVVPMHYDMLHSNPGFHRTLSEPEAKNTMDLLLWSCAPVLRSSCQTVREPRGSALNSRR